MSCTAADGVGVGSGNVAEDWGSGRVAKGWGRTKAGGNSCIGEPMGEEVPEGGVTEKPGKGEYALGDAALGDRGSSVGLLSLLLQGKKVWEAAQSYQRLRDLSRGSALTSSASK